MLDAEKLQGQAGRAAAEPNVANLEDIVRFLQVCPSAAPPPARVLPFSWALVLGGRAR